MFDTLLTIASWMFCDLGVVWLSVVATLRIIDLTGSEYSPLVKVAGATAWSVMVMLWLLCWY